MDKPIVLLIVAAILVPFFLRKVNQGEVGLVENLGLFSHEVGPGLTFLIPGLQTLRKLDIRERAITVSEQQIITKDNVSVGIDGIIYVQITNARYAQYETPNVFLAVGNLAQTHLRYVLGTMSLNDILSHRDSINARVFQMLDQETGKWGVRVMHVETKHLLLWS